VGLALDLVDYHPSVLLHCWLGHLTCKIVSEMTYNVSSGTLNSTIPYHCSAGLCKVLMNLFSWQKRHSWSRCLWICMWNTTRHLLHSTAVRSVIPAHRCLSNGTTQTYMAMSQWSITSLIGLSLRTTVHCCYMFLWMRLMSGVSGVAHIAVMLQINTAVPWLKHCWNRLE